MDKIRILKNCATENQTYFGGEVVMVPQEVPEALARQWVNDGTAEKYVEDAPDATDAAAELAAEAGIDLAEVEGTGAEGRITKGDVEKAIADQEQAE